MEITTIGLDLAKSVFQLHAVDADGAVVWRKKVRRGALLDTLAQVPACLVGMEACATAHYWAREISALGHEVRLMPPAYVKAYLRRQKNDAADAEAICEAVRRPSMRFVAAKGAERQAVLVLHRSRELLVRQRTMLINAIRGAIAPSSDWLHPKACVAAAIWLSGSGSSTVQRCRTWRRTRLRSWSSSSMP